MSNQNAIYSGSWQATLPKVKTPSNPLTVIGQIITNSSLIPSLSEVKSTPNEIILKLELNEGTKDVINSNPQLVSFTKEVITSGIVAPPSKVIIQMENYKVEIAI